MGGLLAIWALGWWLLKTGCIQRGPGVKEKIKEVRENGMEEMEWANGETRKYVVHNGSVTKLTQGKSLSVHAQEVSQEIS